MRNKQFMHETYLQNTDKAKEDAIAELAKPKVITTTDINEVTRLATEGWSYSRPYRGKDGKMWTVYEDPTAGEYIKERMATGSNYPYRWVELPVKK